MRPVSPIWVRGFPEGKRLCELAFIYIHSKPRSVIYNVSATVKFDLFWEEVKVWVISTFHVNF